MFQLPNTIDISEEIFSKLCRLYDVNNDKKTIIDINDERKQNNIDIINFKKLNNLNKSKIKNDNNILIAYNNFVYYNNILSVYTLYLNNNKKTEEFNFKNIYNYLKQKQFEEYNLLLYNYKKKKIDLYEQHLINKIKMKNNDNIYKIELDKINLELMNKIEILKKNHCNERNIYKILI